MIVDYEGGGGKRVGVMMGRSSRTSLPFSLFLSLSPVGLLIPTHHCESWALPPLSHYFRGKKMKVIYAQAMTKMEFHHSPCVVTPPLPPH